MILKRPTGQLSNCLAILLSPYAWLLFFDVNKAMLQKPRYCELCMDQTKFINQTMSISKKKYCFVSFDI